MAVRSYADAHADYAAALAADGGCADAHGSRGALLLEQGAFAQAVADLEAAVRLRPSDEIASRNLETALQRMAEAACSRALSALPGGHRTRGRSRWRGGARVPDSLRRRDAAARQ